MYPRLNQSLGTQGSEWSAGQDETAANISWPIFFPLALLIFLAPLTAPEFTEDGYISSTTGPLSTEPKGTKSLFERYIHNVDR